uniref:Cytochrome P450 3075A2 n=1 Tax=Paracyclopina nana TaxID=565004 RepID=A0A0F7IZX6_PARNA|nr:cytochrome P450 3075A2 [Paracyclopina nana]
MLLVLFITFLALFVHFWRRSSCKPPNFPPGPPRYPIVGSAPFMKPNNSSKPSIFWAICKFAREYGSIFGFYLGQYKTVVLTDYEDIKEVLNKDEASHRPPITGHKLRPGWESAADVDPELNKHQPPGVIFSNGKFWKEQRRYILRNLRDFGFGKASMEETLHEEVQKLIDHLNQYNGQALNLNRATNVSILNALWNILVGEKLELGDPRLAELLQVVDDLVRLGGGPVSPIAAILPHKDMVYWPLIKDVVGIKYPEKAINAMRDFILPYVKAHKASVDADNVRDFMDLFLLEIQKSTDPTSSFYGKNGDNALINDMIDLFIAGMETTTSSLLWSILYLLHFPECQAKIHEEIDRLVGYDHLPSLSDQADLHYTNAFLSESLRFTSFAPMAIFHYTSKDIPLKGYTIPKNSILISSLYHVLYDATHFEEPEVFNPSRFLDSNGKFMPDERVVAFGIGKRICLGKSLAEKEYFLFFAGLMQHFCVKKVPGVELPSIGVEDTLISGFLRAAPLFETIIEARRME